MEPSPGGEFGHEFRSGRHIFQQLEFAACLAVFSVMDGDGGWKTHETCGVHQQIVLLCGGRMRISRGIFPASVLGDSMVASFARNETGSVILLLQPSRDVQGRRSHLLANSQCLLMKPTMISSFRWCHPSYCQITLSFRCLDPYPFVVASHILPIFSELHPQALQKTYGGAPTSPYLPASPNQLTSTNQAHINPYSH